MAKAKKKKTKRTKKSGLGGLGGLMVFLVVMALSYSGYWYYISYYIDDYISEIKDDLRDEGIRMNYDDLSIKGFPYRFSLNFKTLNLSAMQGRHSVNWTSDASELIIQPWNPTHGILLTQKSTISFGSMAAKKQTITLSPASSKISVRFGAGALQQVSMVFDAVQMKTAKENTFYANSLGFHIRMPETGPSLKPLEVNDLVEPALANVALLLRGFGKTDSNTKGDVDLSFTPRGQVTPKLEANALERWRNLGGTIDLDTLKILWNAKTMIADGSLTIDENFYPLGAMTLKVPDADPLRNFLKDMGWATRGEANEISTWVNVWGSKNMKNGLVNIPIMIQDGFVSVAGATLGRLEPITKP